MGEAITSAAGGVWLGRSNGIDGTGLSADRSTRGRYGALGSLGSHGVQHRVCRVVSGFEAAVPGAEIRGG
jgi:hypothetical protein